MRPIEFRGKRGDREWVEGHYCAWQNRHYITPMDSVHEDGFRGGYPSSCSLAGWYLVIPETVGQFTGLKDKNGKDVNWWEGDILKSPDGQIGIISFDEWFGGFRLRTPGGRYLLLACAAADEGWEKIGNRWDNPELLEETK